MLLAVAGMAYPGPAKALSLAPASLPYAFEITGTGSVSGTIDFLGVETGVPASGVVLAGSTQPGDLTFVFTLSNDPGSSDLVPVTSVALTPARGPFPPETYYPTGDGTIPGSGVDVGVDDAVGYIAFPDGVGPGETSDPFFVSFTPSDVEVGDLFNMEFVIFDLGDFTVVPEPAALLVHVLSLGAFACYWRHRSRSHSPGAHDA